VEEERVKLPTIPRRKSLFTETVTVEEEKEQPALRRSLFAAPTVEEEKVEKPTLRTSLFAAPVLKEEVVIEEEVPKPGFVIPEIKEEIQVVPEGMTDVQKELIDMGYAPISEIVITKEGAMEAKYIKVLNKYCQPVYVELDTEGVIAIEKGTVVHVERQEATETPYDIQVEALECAGKDICGVAFECEGGICTLMKEEEITTTPRKTTFIRAEREKEASANMAEDDIAYPVMKFSEIKSNPQVATEIQNKATMRLRNQSYDNLVQEIEDMAQLINALVIEFNAFNDMRDNLSAGVHERLVNLERLKNSYLMTPPVNEAEQEEYQVVLKDLCRQNRIVINILQCGMKLVKEKEFLQKLVQDISKSRRDCLEHVF